GMGGVATNNPSAGYDGANGITADASGIYIAGYDQVPVNDEWRIEKRNLTTGALIAGFGTSGAITFDPSTDYNRANAIVVDATGIYVAGYDYASGSYQWETQKRDLT